MKAISFRSLTYACLIYALAILPCCTSDENVIPKPEIFVNLQNSWAEGFFGFVRGVDSSLFILGIYANINNGWYNLPDLISPSTEIMTDGSWTCSMALDPDDSVSEIAIYLLPAGYLPPTLEGEPKIPLELNLVAAVKKNITF